MTILDVGNLNNSTYIVVVGAFFTRIRRGIEIHFERKHFTQPYFFVRFDRLLYAQILHGLLNDQLNVVHVSLIRISKLITAFFKYQLANYE